MDYSTYIHWTITGAIAIWAAWLQYRATQIGTEHQDSKKVSEEFINLKLKVAVLESEVKSLSEKISYQIHLAEKISDKLDRVICNE